MKLLFCFALTLLPVLPLRAGMFVGPWVPLFQGVDHATGTNVPDGAIPRPQAVNVLRIDLTDPDVSLLVDPRCTNACPGETQGNTTSGFLERYGLQVAINCSFFDPCCSQPVGSSMTVRGLSISRGQTVSPNQFGYQAELLFTTNNVPIFIRSDSPPTNTAGIYTGMSGDIALVTNGVAVFSFDNTINPRTALGISQDNRFLYLMTIDGRQGGYSEGATDNETAAWLLLFGAHNAVNTDGGGSATMVMADACRGQARQLNRPIHAGIPGGERVIANHFGVYARPLQGFITQINALPQSTTATINWTTPLPASSQVAYGFTRNYGNLSPLDPNPVTSHSVTLTGLAPGSNYFFRIFSVADNIQHTADGCFITTNNAPSGMVFPVQNNWRFSSDNLDGVNWTAPDYPDSGWPRGPGLLYAETRPSPPPPGISPKGTQMLANPITTYPYITYYFRTTFTFTNSTAGAELTFSNFIDDGAVFYLNGVEIQRLHLPDPPTVVLNGTLANSVTTGCGDAIPSCPKIFTISGPLINNLVQGTNVLAVEVHNFNAQSPDITFGSALYYRLPAPTPPFITAITTEPSETGSTIRWLTISNSTTQVQYGTTPAYGNSTPLDSSPTTNHLAVITNLQALTRYYFRVVSTVGSTVYSATGQVVTLPFYRSLVPLEGSWKFTTADQAGQGWTARTFSDAAWSPGGPALLYIENATDVVPKNTLLPGTPGSLPPTYYFRTHFQFNESKVGNALVFSNFVDDGAVFYLNGTEIKRLRMAAAPQPIIYTSLAVQGPPFGDALEADVFRVGGNALTNLLSGDNVLAAEVHQATADSSDIVFGSAVGLVRAQASETQLRVTFNAGNLCVTWDGAGMTLQHSSDLANPTAWGDVPGPVTAGPFCLSNPTDKRFYRLRN